jgi:two-component system phosphate regulon sensor histidine kinase PhoR
MTTLLILRDITDLRNLDRMRHDLVANVSHELRTPLTVLLGYLEILKAQPGEPNPEAIERMFKQARQMHALLEDLLELSRLQDTESYDGTTEVDIPAMLAQIAEQAEDLSQGKHKLRFKVEPGLKLRGVETDLKSAFQNLIMNAINYTPEKGSIRVTWQETNDGLVLSVKDDGIGIPHRDIPRITERFYRVGDDRNRKTGGTGLGLAIVKHVLNSHDAKLEVESAPGEGSEFRCIFPPERKT